MKQTASNQFNKFKLTGGICVLETSTAPLSGVITSHPLFIEEIYNETDRNNPNHKGEVAATADRLFA